MDHMLNEAIITSVVGMITVFFILFIIVITGFLLLKILEKTDFMLNKKDVLVEDNVELKNVIGRAILQWSEGRASVKNIKKIER